MHGYYGYGYDPYWTIVGQARQSASEIFNLIQRSLPTQESAVVRRLAVQFNAARQAEARYGGLSGKQLDPEENPRFPRRLVLWYGQSRDRPLARDMPPEFGQGSAMEPVGVFESPDANFEPIWFPLQVAARVEPNIFHALGFERVPEPMMIIVADQYTP